MEGKAGGTVRQVLPLFPIGGINDEQTRLL